MTLSFSDYVAGLAFAVSLYTLYQTFRYRGGDILIAAIKERAELQEAVNGLDGVATSLLNDWRAIMAARGQFRSGAMDQRAQTAQAFQERIDQLCAEFKTIEELEGWNARYRAEATLAKLVSLRAKVNALRAALDDERGELRRNQDDFRNSRRSMGTA